MSKISKSAAAGTAVAGVLLYGIWEDYSTVRFAMILVVAGLIAVIGLIRLIRDRWDHNLLIFLIVAILLTIFIAGTSRKEIGATAVALMFLGGILFAFHEAIKSPNKK